ncbi:MAG: hypothetical protein C9356_04125 [Oleiphilus sp.]|nr:MAG: hypothetical protein C9356_04125 [Oleiphilus sp.]
MTHMPEKSSQKKLTSRIIKAEKASDILLQEMWRLRLDYLELKIERDDDWERFCSNLRQPRTLLITFRDSRGDLQGYFTFAFNPVEHEQRRALLILSKYYYVAKDFRGHPKITSAAFRLLPKIFLRYGFRQIYFIAFSFPTSFVSLSRTFGKAMTLQSPDTPDWEKHVLEEFVISQNGSNWDKQAKVIRHQNVPIGEDREDSKSVSKLREEYLQANPDWAEGNSLPIMMKFDWPTIKAVLKTNLRRRKRIQGSNKAK